MPVYTSKTLPKPAGLNKQGLTPAAVALPAKSSKTVPASIKAARLTKAKAVRKAAVAITMPVFNDDNVEARAIAMRDRFMVYTSVWDNQPAHTEEWKSDGVGYVAQRAQTYGEITPEGMVCLMANLKLGEDDCFLDIGSGLGNMVLYAAYVRNVAMAYGVEIQQNRVDASRRITSEMVVHAEESQMPFRPAFGLDHPDNINANFIHTPHTLFSDCPRLDELMEHSSVIFCNNVLFEASLMHNLVGTLVDQLMCRSALIVFSVDPWPRRSKSHPPPLKFVRTVEINNAASWAAVSVKFAIYTLWDNANVDIRSAPVHHVYDAKQATADGYVRAIGSSVDSPAVVGNKVPIMDPLGGFVDFETCVEYAIKSAEAHTASLRG